MPSERPDRSEATGNRDRNVSRREVLGGLAAVGSLAVAGCSSIPGLGGRRPVWRRDIDGAFMAGPPAVTDELVLVGMQDKALYGLRREDGSTALRFETGGPIEARPVAPASGGPYHVHSTDGDLYAVDSAGDELWRDEGTPYRARLVRTGSLVAELDLAGPENTLAGYDPQTGDRRFERAVSSYFLNGVTDDSFVVPVPVSETESRVTSLSPADGSVRWRTEPRRWYSNVVADARLVVAARDGTLTAFERSDGSVRWRVPIGDVGRTMVLGSQAYLTRDRDGGRQELLAFDRETGERLWENPTGYQIRAVEATDDAVFVGSRVDDPDGGILGRIDCFGLDGTRRWQTVTGLPSLDSLGVTDSRVVAVWDRGFEVLARETGASRWSYEPESYSRLSLRVEPSSVFVSYVGDGAVARFPLD
ncbi:MULTISPECIES: outer membrane protein assembly factor BamB family protein [Haloferax]|uniref:Outer membrane protein assembly factor BamB n=1 Tax=Haloferax massiliensis TaxID=1476858 RepID=A0A0D6JUY6_9EURY|nr:MULTISPECIES: PQQ-binding-like beta-propeller repeat protein [Haloferax]MDS0241486.1 PQQ-binding-like beta-propeller repeat protein [Haloferax sp. S2CR25]MDS0444607.1 PQQ-binding-like beta-propeller repeat protein [Haloferax sp. S2CR25-2]CQR52005.1 Outer membrane protein assembly factor BamB [Haloferax massiliensis]